jgi:phage gp36-like protein
VTYATLDQLKAKLGEQTMVSLTDRDLPRTGAIVVAVVDRALTDTDATIDGFLAGRYRLPIEGGIPAQVTDLALAIAAYKLHPFKPDDKIQKDYDDARSDLAKIADGRIRLSIAGLEPASSGATGVQVTDRERPLTADSLRGFI